MRAVILVVGNDTREISVTTVGNTTEIQLFRPRNDMDAILIMPNIAEEDREVEEFIDRFVGERK